MTDQPRNELESGPGPKEYEPPVVEDMTADGQAVAAAGAVGTPPTIAPESG
jgi:hypothetical protein